MRILTVYAGCCIMLYAAACTSTKTLVVGEDSEEETSVLLDAQHGLPADTSGGMYSVGTARPGESSHLAARAEHNALLRFLGALRNKLQVPPDLSETLFFACIEENASLMHIATDSLARGAVQATVFIGRENIQTLLDCLKK